MTNWKENGEKENYKKGKIKIKVNQTVKKNTKYDLTLPEQKKNKHSWKVKKSAFKKKKTKRNKRENS